MPLKDGGEPCPRGWHRLAGALWCPKCWEDNFALRSIELPVASVIQEYAGGNPGEWSQEACRAGWEAFRKALRQSSLEAAQYSNLALAELYAADRAPIEKKEDGKVKLPTLPAVPLYQLGRDRFPELDSQSMGSLKQKAQAKYREQRWDLRVTAKESLSTYRRGLPVPIPAKDARLEVSHRHQEGVAEEDRGQGRGQPFLFVRLAGQRFTLRLRSGAGDRGGHYSFWRKVAALERVESGQALQGEVKLYERRTPSLAHRNGGSTRAAPGAPSGATRVFAAIAVWLPKEKGEREQVEIRVVTSPDRLWNVFVNGNEDRPWLLNEEQARRWVIARRKRLQSLSEDAKFERRSRLRGEPVQPADLASVRQRISDTYKKRLDDWAHKVSMMLANFAKRQRAFRVVYDDREKGWSPGLPWFKIQSMLQDKLNRFGIEFLHAKDLEEEASEQDA